ncbi:CRISPR-associated protein Csn1 [Candidatus Sulfidibacterium hydrothermale]|uniref:type II CRISPR RNA-guided endonuclease Cas9 n=1 Tax=Candidatus Sulfidibacterium hydrothermale TaxID=2875962 RepID=UPI001F0A83F1|nr:type II CRISPR RNA-guided endonuclease Cas9 [Candidatus Sulfidibacterium hydrothermale]UBM62077.1 CRISPR-associated protein Csn1 [Candidatus Sulfidibacterium hydrothermale]
MKKILGLDLGTNSIGWALINLDFDNQQGSIQKTGSRIIPMDQAQLTDFASGNSISQTAERTRYRGIRRLYQRSNLRRERLHRVLKILDFLPEHYKNAIDFEKHPGQFRYEVKINYQKTISGKYEFVYIDSFKEMVDDFKSRGLNIKIPYDWTIYYLRKKALTQKISKEEIAWLLLNFNQKRGYYQLRGDEIEENDEKDEKYYALKVIDVKETEDKNAKGIWYNVILENNWVYKRLSKEPLTNWIGKTKEFIVTTTVGKDGTLKRSFRSPKEDDWNLLKKKTEQDIESSEKQVGEYIYDVLLQNPAQKIRGKLIRTIERKYYKTELQKILQTQISFHPELQDKNLYEACLNELYPHNEAHRQNIDDKGFQYLFLEDIIFYQRPLKSKKSTIAGCQFETRTFKKTETDVITGIEKEITVTEPLKAIAKSHPLYQEFRLWQFLKNLKIYQINDDQGKLIDKDVTNELFQTEAGWTDLFDFLSVRKDVEQKNIIQYLITKNLIDKKQKNNYRWNYVEDKKYPANETKMLFLSRLRKLSHLNADEFLTDEIEQQLWHLIYSIKDLNEYEKALHTFAKKHNLDEEAFVENFIKFPSFKNEYGTLSEKAIKKLLPLMRMGKYWSEDAIDRVTKNRIEKILTGEFDEKIQDRVREKTKDFTTINDFKGLPLWLASYVVYNRHAESGNIKPWKSPEDIDKYLREFKQHSLRNPIVEQVVTETLRTVRDIWDYYGNSKENFFDEIHIELGREMKNPAEKRKQITQKIIENENTNQRIKAILQELKNEGIPEIKPYSPSQQEILKIYEEGVYQNPNAKYDEVSEDEIEKIRKASSPTVSEIIRYKLWLSQGYISPYTGKIIPLSKLFSTDYQIEHIIPQSRYFDDSMSNKVICESEVNQLKDNQTAYEFIKNHGGEKVDLGQGKSVEIFKLDDYENHCNKYFKKNRTKLKNLLSEDVPEGFINRQLNDSRYISKLIKGLLSNIVRQEDEQEAVAKNIVTLTGSITSVLKQNWGLNNKWNEIIAPRFKRLNELTGSNNFGFWDFKINAFRIQVPDEVSKGFSKKRIDHRHHALDALVIACCTKDHINYITSLNTQRENYSLISKLRIVENVEKIDPHTGEIKSRKVAKAYKLPWPTFPMDAKNALEKTVVSFKQNIRVINRSKNKTWQWVEKDGKLKKQLVQQTKGDNWAIRKPLHKEMVSGKVLINKKKKVSLKKAFENPELIINQQIRKAIQQVNVEDRIHYFKENPLQINGKKVTHVSVYTEATAVRTPLSEIKNYKHIEKITDSGIKEILIRHLQNFVGENGKANFDAAFSPEGIDELNKNIKQLNGGKKHQPIYKVRLFEEGNKFAVGTKGNRSKKYVEAAKGTNLFFAVYLGENGKRNFETVPLNEVIEHQKQTAHLPKDKRTPVLVKPEKGEFLFTLSPNDLVYVPTEEERENPALVDFKNLKKEQVNRIYKMVSCTGNRLYCIQNNISKPIYNKFEFSKLNKLEFDLNNFSIKERCWKLKTDRLGNIIQVTR